MDYAQNCSDCVVFNVEIAEMGKSISDVCVLVWNNVFDVSHSLEGVTSEANEYSTQACDNKH